MKFYQKIVFCILLCATTVACKKNVQDEVVEVISGNVTFTNFVQSSADNYFVLDQNKIRFLNTSSPNSLNISSTLPFTETAFELVRGNNDTLYIQQTDGIHLYIKRLDGTVRWEQQSVIANVKPCDKFNVRFPFLLVSSGNPACNFSGNQTELKLIDINNMASPITKSILTTTSVQRIELSPLTNGFYVATVDGQLNSVGISTDSTAVIQNVLNEPGLSDFSVFGNKLFVKNRNNISQYELTSASNAQLLSKIPVVK